MTLSVTTKPRRTRSAAWAKSEKDVERSCKRSWSLTRPRPIAVPSQSFSDTDLGSANPAVSRAARTSTADVSLGYSRSAALRVLRFPTRRRATRLAMPPWRVCWRGWCAWGIPRRLLVHARLVDASAVAALEARATRFVRDPDDGGSMVRWVGPGQVARFCRRAFERNIEKPNRASLRPCSCATHGKVGLLLR